MDPSAVDATSEIGETPLMLAAQYSREDVLEVLLNAGQGAAKSKHQ